MNLTVKDLSPDQRAAYDSINRWIRENPAPPQLDEEDWEAAPVLTLGGFAGTGKSTLVSLVAEEIELPAFCAYTGKAASVLRRKLKASGTDTVGTQRRQDGFPSSESRAFCGTIHSLIYRPCDCLQPVEHRIQKPCLEENCLGETRWEAGSSRCAEGHASLYSKAEFDELEAGTKYIYAKKGDDGRCVICHGKEWIRRETLDRNYDLIIVDEASMVDDNMLADLQSFGVPILAVGDHGQLPPVGGSSALMKNPALRLERIHRQAEGNPIIALSKYIRENGSLPDKLSGEEVSFRPLRLVEQLMEQRYGDANAKRLLEMGLACYTNRRRMGLNVAVRRARGLARNGRELGQKGEHVVCLRNIKAKQGRPPVANGMRGVLLGDIKPKLVRDKFGEFKNDRGEASSASRTLVTGEIEFPEDGIQGAVYEMLSQQFGREKTFGTFEELMKETGLSSFSAAGNLFDFGYAMTVHKMQGSAVEDLVVVVERPGPVSNEDWRRWLYTAVTRASQRLTLLR